MDRKDLKAITIIGAAIGLLVQPILANVTTTVTIDATIRVGIFLFFLILAPLALWICILLAKLWKGIYEFSKFAAVGTLNSFIDVGIFNLEVFIYGSSIIGTVLFAVFKAISFLCATTNSFFWNKYWTFSSNKKPDASEVSAFYGVAIVGWILNVGLATGVKIIGPANSSTWVDIIAPLSGVAGSFIWNFLGYKYLVFKTKPLQKSE